MSIVGSVDKYVQRDGKLINIRGSIFQPFDNPMTPADARQIADKLTELATEAERPEYKPGKIYQSIFGTRYLRTIDGDWVALHGSSVMAPGEVVANGFVAGPLTEVSI